MDETHGMSHLTVRVPAELLSDLDRIAGALDRSRSWVVLRALRQYLDTEGAEVLEDAESIAALERGEGVDLDKVLDDAEALIDRIEAKRMRRAV